MTKSKVCKVKTILEFRQNTVVYNFSLYTTGDNQVGNQTLHNFTKLVRGAQHSTKGEKGRHSNTNSI